MLPEDGILTSNGASPIAEITKDLAPEGIVKLKFPLALVVVPVRVPLTITEALATGVPVASETFPETVRVCAGSCPIMNNMPHKKSKIFLMSFCLV
jgi:hypothetical protein